MKKLYFGTNLKMYKNIQETTSYLQELADLTKNINRDEVELFVIPSYTSLSNAVNCIDKNCIKIGAQNISWEIQGQFTGEISPLMLRELDIDLVMIGHSERRHIFGETDSIENKKVITSLSNDFTTLLCIGETLEEKNYNISDEVLRTQLKVGLHHVSKEKLSKIWIAYEPVWAIGVNGIPAPVDYAEEKHEIIKKCLSEMFGNEGLDIPVLYGGSVNSENADKLIIQPSIDGLFIGRSAWQSLPFNKLIRDAIVSYKNYCKDKI